MHAVGCLDRFTADRNTVGTARDYSLSPAQVSSQMSALGKTRSQPRGNRFYSSVPPSPLTGGFCLSRELVLPRSMACRSSVLFSFPYPSSFPGSKLDGPALFHVPVIKYDLFLTTLSGLTVLFLHAVIVRHGITLRLTIPIHETTCSHSLRLLNHQQNASTTMNTGDELVIAMWAMTALTLALVVLRLYTRIVVVKFIGAEDYMYAGTGVLMLGFTIGIQMAVRHGLGQDFWRLSLDNSSQAIFWTYVANSFAIIGNATAKLSMGLFLLRVVQVTWHKIALWSAVVITTATSIALTVMLWNQTTPVQASWDVLRTPGVWKINIQPTSVGLGGESLVYRHRIVSTER